jgi:transposase
MAMGKRKQRLRQSTIWIATSDLPRTAAHPFYERINRILDKAGFDAHVEKLCAPFYAERMGRPSLAPGRYFRLLVIGYFEGLDSERAIAWRTADSFALRRFLDLELPEAPPDHSTISRTRRLIDVETHREVFTWILKQLAEAGLVKGKTIGMDATTLEANAALRSIVRRDTGESYQEFLTQLAEASGIETPTREELARLDRKRKNKGSNDDWTHPQDPDAKITKMKDGRTHLAHKAEHAVDLETGAVVAVTVQGADQGDTPTSSKTLIEAAEQIEAVVPDSEGPKEVVADKGYHSNQALVNLEAVGVRSYISEPARGRRNWMDNPEARDAVYRNRRRIRGERGKRLLRQRGELLERPFAHLYETGGMRRVYLRGHQNILKRILLHAAALNLGLLMRTLFGVGTPRGLQGRVAALFIVVGSLVRPLDTLWLLLRSWYRPITSTLALQSSRKVVRIRFTFVSSFATGC